MIRIAVSLYRAVRPAGSPAKNPQLASVRKPREACSSKIRKGSASAKRRCWMSLPQSPPARRLERAHELVAQGRVTQSRQEAMTYHVSALSNRHAYTVHLLGPKLCDCADSNFRRVHCKHYLAASLVHIETVASQEEQQTRRSAKIARRVICAECQFEMPATDPCPNCGRLVCLKCFDGASGVCLGCPVGGEDEN